jgi:perosamine synthetase
MTDKPVREKKISYGRQTISAEDENAVLEVLRSDFLTQGPTVELFETEFARFVGRKYAVAFANGTAALHGAYHALGIGPGDELLTTPMTFASTSNAALFLGGSVRFADVDPKNGLVDPADVVKKITKKTKAICPVHFAGMLADMPELMRAAHKKGIAVVEDACHALGATGWGRQAGTFGDLGVFSFHPVKPITTGEGGMVVTDSLKLAKKMRLFRTHGIEKTDPSVKKNGPWFYEMKDLGFNYRLTDMQCALGISQLKRYEAFLAHRRAIAREYDIFIEGIDGIEPCRPIAGTQSAYHLYPILVEPNRFKGGRRGVFEALHYHGIGVQVHYIPVNAHPFYRKLGFSAGQTPNARRFYSMEISLPIFPSMTDGDIGDVKEALEKTAKALRR